MARLLCLLWATALCHAATFGTAVPVRGTVSDIALDEHRGLLYAADFSGGRIQVLRTPELSFVRSLAISAPASALALSPDGRYLIAGHYLPFPDDLNPGPNGGYTIFDLNNGSQQEVMLANPVLAVAFGADSRALMVTSGEFLRLDPATARTETLSATLRACRSLPVPLATFPPSIIWASSGVSGDGQTIVILARTASHPQCDAVTQETQKTDAWGEALMRYSVATGELDVINWMMTPPLGPRAVSVNQDASAFVAGWVLFDSHGFLRAQFPYPSGEIRLGGIAFDSARNRIYADIPVEAGEAPVLHVVDTDNLTVRERIRLPQAMAGRSVFSSDGATLYAVSDSGILVLPLGTLAEAPRVVAAQEDLLFQGNACNRQVLSQTLDLASPNGGSVDFKLSLSQSAGIRLSQASGTTPASVRIEVDPTVFQAAHGTTTVQLTIASSQAVNLPLPLRLLINTHPLDQRGQLVHVPGKIVDVLADRARNRVYLVRQDQNLVLAYDTTTFQLLASLRTGNTPVGMGITFDNRYLLVGNDNSQLASVFDLEMLQPAEPVLFPNAYPRTFAVAPGAIWATVRSTDSTRQGLFRVDFSTRTANPPPSLGVYCNIPLAGYCTNPVPPDAVVAATPNGTYVLLAIKDGSVALWDGSIDRWAVARKDFTSLGGAYGALTDDRFVVDQHFLDASLYPVADMPADIGASSGVAAVGGFGLRTAAAQNGSGIIERVDWTSLETYHATSVYEAPVTAVSLFTPPVGQIGETILPFTRSLAVTPDQSSVLILSTSGLTVVPLAFDTPATMPDIAAVGNAADGGPAAPGGLISIWGTGLAPGSAVAGLPWPNTLGEVCATINGVPVPFYRVTATEISAQLPFNVAGSVPFVLETPGGASASFVVNLQSLAPAVFRTGVSGDQYGLATVLRAKNNDLVTFTNPIHPDEMISIYLTGMGPTTPSVQPGMPAPADPLSIVITPPAVTLGGTPLTVTFAGLAPGLAGVYQINAYVPHGVADAAQTPLTIVQGGASTSVSVRVVNP